MATEEYVIRFSNTRTSIQDLTNAQTRFLHKVSQSKTGKVLSIICWASIFLFLTFVFLWFQNDIGFGFFLGVTASVLVVIVTNNLLRRRIVNAHTELELKKEKQRGPTTATFDGKGIKFESLYGSSFLLWSSIDEIVKTKSGFLLRIGANLLSVPVETPPDNLSDDEFHAQLVEWRKCQ